MTDTMIFGLLVVLGVGAAILRLLLDRQKGQPRAGLWLAAPFVLPVLLLAAMVLDQRGHAGAAFWTILMAMVVDFTLSRLWKRRNRQTD